MFYTVYKTTNLINGKFYIGTHKTNDPNDDYLGSGKLLKKAVDKYGSDNFRKEVLFIFDNPADMFAKEAELVSEEFLADNNTYNLKIGGYGGWHAVGSAAAAKLGRASADKSIIEKYGVTNPSQIPKVKQRLSENLRNRIDRGEMPRGNPKGFLGKRHAVESKSRIGAANSVKQKGDRNSQYGSMWITDGISSKKVKSSDPIPDRWRRGRTRAIGVEVT